MKKNKLKLLLELHAYAVMCIKENQKILSGIKADGEIGNVAKEMYHRGRLDAWKHFMAEINKMIVE